MQRSGMTRACGGDRRLLDIADRSPSDSDPEEDVPYDDEDPLPAEDDEEDPYDDEEEEEESVEVLGMETKDQDEFSGLSSTMMTEEDDEEDAGGTSMDISELSVDSPVQATSAVGVEA